MAELVAQLRRDPLRMALTLFGVVLGTASVVFIASLLSAAGSALSRVNQQANGRDVTRIEGLANSMRRAQNSRPLRDNDVSALADKAEVGVNDAASGTRLMSQEAVVGKQRMYVGVQSGGGTWADIAHLELAHGRSLSDADASAPVCILGSDVHSKLFNGEWPLPEDARLVLNNDVLVRPVGVFKPRPPIGGGGGDGTWRFDRRIYVTNTLFKRSVLNDSNQVQEIVMRHKPKLAGITPDLAVIAKQLTPLLARMHQGVANFQFEVENPRKQNDELIVVALAGILLACGAIALVVGGVNVTNAQMVNVVEKTKELAIRRALGASSADLSRAVLSETISMTLLGGAIGVAVGASGAFLLAQILSATLTEWPFVLVPWSCGVSLGAALLVGLLAGFFPARRASRLSVSECLRDAP